MENTYSKTPNPKDKNIQIDKIEVENVEDASFEKIGEDANKTTKNYSNPDLNGSFNEE